jgi:hypothetical protein
MAHVVCQVTARPDQLTFTWSDGPASFAPYHLTGQGLLDFRSSARAARDCLRRLVEDYQGGSDDDVRQTCLALAQAGFKLYQQLFRPAAEQKRLAREVLEWLDQLQAHTAVESLEIIHEGAEAVPWNVVYDHKPDEKAFRAGGDAPERWEPFWGIRYNLVCGRRVEPLRRLPFWQKPAVLLVLDPDIRRQLSDEKERRRLEEFVRGRNVQVIESRMRWRRPWRTGGPT